MGYCNIHVSTCITTDTSRATYVDVEEDAGLVASVHAGNRNEWAGGAAANALDVDLSAAEVELGASVGRSDVESDLTEGSACSATTDESHPIPTCSTRMRYWPLGRLLGMVKVTSVWAV